MKFPYSAPLNVCLSITSRCNLDCKHCINRNLSASESDLTTQELFKVIDQLGQAKVFNISIFGGEPLTHPDFFQIVDYLNKYPFSLSLNTNATLIDRSVARQLKEHNIKRSVVSFDGSNEQVMDNVRGEGSFKKNIRGIEALVTEGLDVLLSVTVTKLNYKDIRQMVLLGKKLNARAIRFNFVFVGGNAICFIKEIYLSPKEELEIIEEVCRLKKEFPDFVSGDSAYLFQKNKLEEMKTYTPSTDKISIPFCGAATSKCNIRADGWVTPCELIWEAKCGNLKEQNFTDIWQNSKMMQEIREPLELDLNEIPECKGCQYQYICFIGHRCYPYYYPGGIKDKSLYCWLDKNKAKEEVRVDALKP